MILIGAYPRSIDDANAPRSSLKQLFQIVATLPRAVALHVLPFGPSDGDGGFAPRDWFGVDPSLGGWRDIERLGTERRLVVDGIYNHVGVNHDWTQEWISKGQGAERLHVFPFQPTQHILSPRGASVFHPYNIQGKTWWAWQTFSPNAIDVQLGNEVVQSTIDRHLAFLSDRGVSAVRLDSIAYYGKKIGGRQRHHPLGIKYARSIASNARKYGLTVIPQLNCDSWGEQYFPKSLFSNAPLTDFAYSAILALTILTARPEPLIAHIKRVQDRGLSVLRALRTHDGILLKTSLLRASDRHALIKAFAEYHVSPRIVERRRYEFNCSFPYLCSLGTDLAGMWRRIEMTLALTACLPGVCYVYLPLLFGFKPESDGGQQPNSDPRMLNRTAMTSDFVARASSSFEHKRILTNLQLLASIREQYGLERNDESVSLASIGKHGIVVRRANGRVVLIVNLSRERSLRVPTSLGDMSFGNVVRGRIPPLGFSLWSR
jgi:hypothetical protein